MNKFIIVFKIADYSKLMKAAILAGGFGKRLRPLTDSRPKPLIEIDGVPIVVLQIEWLKRYGVDEAVLCVGYMREVIQSLLGDGSNFGIRIQYAIEEEPLGTGGALKNAESMLNDEKSFLVLNGDVITNLDPSLLREKLENGAWSSMSVVPLRSPFGIVDIENDLVKGFLEKPLIQEYSINAGIYCFSGEIFAKLPDKGSIETQTFPALATEGKLAAVSYPEAAWRSIDSHKDIEDAAKEFGEDIRQIKSRSL
ncbi:MAG: NDP-sugar synthase [Nitrososphaerales archaeon]